MSLHLTQCVSAEPQMSHMGISSGKRSGVRSRRARSSLTVSLTPDHRPSDAYSDLGHAGEGDRDAVQAQHDSHGPAEHVTRKCAEERELGHSG
jgi:hypothetical protein